MQQISAQHHIMNSTNNNSSIETLYKVRKISYYVYVMVNYALELSAQVNKSKFVFFFYI